MKTRKFIVGFAAAAVIGVFLLALSSLGAFNFLGVSGVTVMLATFGFFCIAAVAAVVALFWGHR
jgi:hypothetical protein